MRSLSLHTSNYFSGGNCLWTAFLMVLAESWLRKDEVSWKTYWLSASKSLSIPSKSNDISAAIPQPLFISSFWQAGGDCLTYLCHSHPLWGNDTELRWGPAARWAKNKPSSLPSSYSAASSHPMPWQSLHGVQPFLGWDSQGTAARRVLSAGAEDISEGKAGGCKRATVWELNISRPAVLGTLAVRGLWLMAAVPHSAHRGWLGCRTQSCGCWDDKAIHHTAEMCSVPWSGVILLKQDVCGEIWPPKKQCSLQTGTFLELLGWKRELIGSSQMSWCHHSVKRWNQVPI